MQATWNMIRVGALTGLALTVALAVWDHLSTRGYLFGLRTGIVGTLAGGIALLLALGMAVTSYVLARRNQVPWLRRRLLAAAIFTGAAGMLCGVSSALLWLAVGQPWFP